MTGNRRHPRSVPGSILALLAAILGGLALPAGDVVAHAEPERAEPPINGIVATAPTVVAVWFSQEVSTGNVTLTVIGPSGQTVDQGDTTLDLQDLERRRVTISLQPALGPGTYTVQWQTLSAEDDESAAGTFNFTIHAETPNATASPVSSPAATPIATSATAGMLGSGGTPMTPESHTASVLGIPAPIFLGLSAGLAAAAVIWFFGRYVQARAKRDLEHSS